MHELCIAPLSARERHVATALEMVAWPQDIRASAAQLDDRLRSFPSGFLGAFIRDDCVGMASCQITEFSLTDALKPWSELTADGWISRTHRPDGNCLHCVSICVRPDFRNRGIGTALNRARVELASQLGLEFALTDTRLPGLASYLRGLRKATPEGYVDAIVREEIVEPAVRMYLHLGFKPLGLIADCMESDRESANYGLAMLKDLNERSDD